MTIELAVVQISGNRAVVAVIMVIKKRTPELQPGQQAQIVSWLGTYDREVA
jgi:hypothetical protein